jgi:murein DD-endopeptidase MepM/ murein hydrolase activator NlpD
MIYRTILLLLVLIAAVSARAGEPTLTYTATREVAPGGVIFLTVAAPAAERVSLGWGTTRVAACRRDDGAWEAVLGVPATTRPGTHDLTVCAAIGGEVMTSGITVTVTKRSFPIQRLRMGRAQESKYTAPSVAEEYRLIGAALRQATAARAWSGGFRLPITGRLATAFGTQRYRNGKKVGIHKGLDLSAPEGTPVYAANAGTVVLRRGFGLHGNTLVVAHGDGIAGLYLHLSQFCVREGDIVTAGQLIGRVGHTGAATGPHLHYALYAHGTPVDPLLLRSVPAGW